jgi:hypothetical protein
MKTVALAGLILAAGLALAPAAKAETFTPLPGFAGMSLAFNSGPGMVSRWQVTDLGGANALRATLQIHRLGSHPRLLPAFSLAVRTPHREAGLQLVADDDGKLIVAPFDGDLSHPRNLDEVAKLALDTTLDVTISWTDAGVVTVTAGNQTRRFALDGPITGLFVFGSTGEIEFNQITLGHLTP